MSSFERLQLITAARNHYRLVLANLTVAALCVVVAMFQIMTGSVYGGLLIVAVSFLAFFNALHHEKEGDDSRAAASRAK